MLSIVMVLFCVWGYAQELPTVIPPSPTAFELTKFELFPVGLNTGTPSVSVPLFVYKTKNIKVPISLSYSSNGIKVDQLSSNVGLGWSLNIGGIITRIVRGKEDENYRLTHPVKEVTRSDVQGIEDLDPQATFHQTSDVNPDIVSFLYDASTDSFDSESDLFSYSMGGYSGKIVVDNNGIYRTIPHSNIKIERSNSSGFKITTEDGVAYYFNDKEVLYSRTNCDNAATLPPEQAYTTSWYLSKIEHPLGDIVNFVYDINDTEEFYLSSISQTLELASSYPITSDVQAFPTNMGLVTCENFSRVYRKRLIEVNSNDSMNGKVLIDNSLLHPDSNTRNYRLIKGLKTIDSNDKVISKADFSYDFTTNDRVFLREVVLKDPSNKYAFQYNDFNAVPKRFSYSQDFWGYFNGKNNQLLLPNLQETYPVFNKATNRLGNRDLDTFYAKKGLLTKVVYPTKGSTVFEYEGNDHYRLVTTKIYDYKSVSIRGNNSQFSTFSLGDNNNENFDAHINYTVTSYENSAEGCYEYPADKASATVRIYDISNEPSILVYEKGFIPSTGASGFVESLSLNQNKTYKLEIFNSSKPGDCIEASASLRIIKRKSEYKNILTGGNRIKSLKNYDTNNAILNSKYYYYSGMNDLVKSSGDATRAGLGHVSSRTQYHLYGGAFPKMVSQGYVKLSSSGSFPITNSGSNNVYYRKVTISHGGDNFENGGEEHEFIINRDGVGEQLLGTPRVIPNFTNFGWNNGLEKKVSFFKKPLSKTSPKTIVKDIIKNYKLDRTISEVANYNVVKDYNIVTFQPAYPTYKCKAEDLDNRISLWQCTTNHSHAITGSGWLDSVTYYSPDPVSGYGPITMGDLKCRKSFGTSNNVLVGYIDGHCYEKAEGEEVSFPQIVQNLNVVKYKTNSYWHYLDQTIERQYDINGENPITTTTNYFYDNPSHLQQTRVEVMNSKGKVLKTETKYAHDVNDTILINEHRIGEPIETKSYKENMLLSWQKKVYDNQHNPLNLYLPSKIKTAKDTQALEDRIIYHSYNDKGNPTEVSKKDGTKIYYVWGYQQTQPIAKIEGYTDTELTNIQGLINAAISASNSDTDAASENNLRTALNNIRNNANMVNSQVTTFTYDPLIGVTSVTDPRGQTMYYQYDEFNRLKFVKDADGNLLKEHKYNYKN
ncbi:putative YD repeat-containing protein [Tenacibaculum sediminilitoris]